MPLDDMIKYDHELVDLGYQINIGKLYHLIVGLAVSIILLIVISIPTGIADYRDN